MTCRLISAFAAAALAVAGCGPSGRVREEAIEVKEDTPLNRAKKLLEGYAKGQPLGSETTSFENLVKGVREHDQTRGDILEKGFADLQKTKGGGTAAKAREILTQLAPKMKGE